uniref:Uncharacterized protein n=1 Tax=Glossina austeni TaxID=7395 RepID=A0A1A9VUC3_GLOAU
MDRHLSIRSDSGLMVIAMTPTVAYKGNAVNTLAAICYQSFSCLLTELTLTLAMSNETNDLIYSKLSTRFDVKSKTGFNCVAVPERAHKIRCLLLWKWECCPQVLVECILQYFVISVPTSSGNIN